MRLVLATRNAGKVREFRQLLADLADLDIVSLGDLADIPDVVEDGTTFEANARKKAVEIARATQSMTLADDSGLEVDALDGRPGVHSARYAGESATDADNNQKLVAELSAVPAPQRTARYRAVLVFFDPQSNTTHAEAGVCEGTLELTPRGEGGFGYDPYFVPAGHDCTMAELSPEAKNAISHRGHATRAMAAFLHHYFTRPPV